ncbi:MAG: hypothetical protein DRH12_19530 [Deltaproteobacteria bacterium]|nr:MAG: hypothetical protein DRH12_19530 [Deltaproteobacteria bacterium]
MSSIKISDDCLHPERYVYLKYSGPDPWGVVGRISERIRPFFHVSSSGTNQTRINWDDSGDPIWYFSTWWVKKSLSDYSNMLIHIKVIGNKSKTTNTGEFTMAIWGYVQTEFSGWAVFLKPIYIIYSYLFYHRLRRKFIEICRNYIMNFRNEIKEHFNLEKTDVPMSYGSYG